MKRSFTLLFAILITASINAQTPQRMSYQAVIRDAGNNLVIKHMVGMRISILQGSPTGGYMVYTEMQNPTTNENGLISIEIGGLFNFNSIDWAAGPYYLRTETDPTGGADYTISGTSQLLSVPYALHAKTAESITGGITILPPSATVYSPYNIQSSSATINGMVNGNGFLTRVVFEWGLTTSYGNTVAPAESPVSGIYDASVSTNLTELTSGTEYNYRIKVSNAVNEIYSNNISFTTSTSIPELTTTAISSITGSSASTGGNITHGGGLTVFFGGVYYGTNPNPTSSDNVINHVLLGSTTFTSNLTGLTPGTTYYVRAWASNANGFGYGNERSFTTPAVPTVVTLDLSDIKGNSAYLGGLLTNNGGSTITAEGLCWSTSPNPTPATGNISASYFMSGLSPNTVYYARAYATNSAGTGYGNEISFNSGRIIGSAYSGGLVYYNDGNGHGLICAGFDQSTGAVWGCSGTTIGGTLIGINTGAANTNAIVAGCPTAGIAARICYDLVLGGYSDWYLPSKRELIILYENLHMQNLGGFTNNTYWSSTESTNLWAETKDFFENPLPINILKTSTYYVRAVRSF